DESASLVYPRIDTRASWVRFIEAATFRGRTGSDVSGESTRTRFFTQGGSDIYTAGVDVSYPLFDGGDAYYARRSSEAALEAEQHDREQVLRDLELEVSTAFLNATLAEGAITIARDALRFRSEERRVGKEGVSRWATHH